MRINVFNYYQPIVDIDFKCVGFEVLLRGFFKGEIVGAAECLDEIASGYGFVTLALNQINEVLSLRQEIKDVYFSINVTSDFFKSKEVIEFLDKIDVSHRRYIQFEILETVRFSSDVDMIYNAKKINSLGYMFKLDDFLSGESSVFPFINFDFESIKIDLSVIANYKDNKRIEALLMTLIYYCSISNCNSIAEGVESIDVFYDLKSLGVSNFQGFLFSKPMPKSEVISNYKKLKKWIYL
ncbi:diguanylate phosphodiesterase (plasmid) [Enterobacter soli]|uniref:EAL domain-containing protein n=1 Tax=Enterobacter soli TaxID=885040 RepID=UPI000223CEC1|nr:EAL domain-containing protein [Enterobacter soli]AEN67185.1 diguanylate phosphodiesterase [Enterobacter soli]OAT35099.1 hypothetical protein M987_04552 [Enterobacter soli ATCC BAA-2102]